MLCRMKNLINRNKLYSIPAWLGKAKALRVSELLHVFSAACVLIAGWLWKFWMALLDRSGYILSECLFISIQL